MHLTPSPRLHLSGNLYSQVPDLIHQDDERSRMPLAGGRSAGCDLAMEHMEGTQVMGEVDLTKRRWVKQRDLALGNGKLLRADCLESEEMVRAMATALSVEMRTRIVKRSVGKASKSNRA